MRGTENGAASLGELLVYDYDGKVGHAAKICSW